MESGDHPCDLVLKYMGGHGCCDNFAVLGNAVMDWFKARSEPMPPVTSHDHYLIVCF